MHEKVNINPKIGMQTLKVSINPKSDMQTLKAHMKIYLRRVMGLKEISIVIVD